MSKLCCLLPLLWASAAPAQDRVAPGQFVAWTQKDGPKTLTSGGTTAAITAAPCEGEEAGPDCYRAELAVTVAGKPPVTLMGESGRAYRVAIGRLNAGDSGASVVLQTFTGGAHCCDVFTVAEPLGDAVRIVPIAWRPERASEPQTEFDFGDIPFPADLSGDGRADFVLRDDRFLYEFASYAGSMAPPIVLGIEDGKTVDVSADPAFAETFGEELRQAKAICTDAQGFDRNGACAAYVGAAARLGRFDEAWAVMLRHYDRRSTTGLTRCTSDYVDDKCPHEEHFKDFPAALRAFLIRTGYIAG